MVNGIGLWYPGDSAWTDYYFAKNLQGDVLAVYNAAHQCVATYSYDSWGNILTESGSLAELNPFRYRGYYYDVETELYYLQSRYYDPQVGRFINADSLVTTGNGMTSSNMFAYCLNNPVNGCDPCGTCFHRLDFWNDCEKCGGKTIGEKLNDFATGLYDYGTAVYAAHMMQIESQQQVDQNSFRYAMDSTVAVSAAIVQSVETQNNALQREHQTIHTVVIMPFATVDWEYVGKETIKEGVITAVGAAATSATAAYLGAPFLGGASIPASAFLGGITGFIGGCATGFVRSLWEELE